MAGEKDEPGWLPEPPPPRPARRDAAIDAAMRRFDGVPDAAAAAPERPGGRWWPAVRGPQLTVLVSAMLVVVVGIPATLIGLRNERPPVESVAPKQAAPAPRPHLSPSAAAPAADMIPRAAPVARNAPRAAGNEIAGSAPIPAAPLAAPAPPVAIQAEPAPVEQGLAAAAPAPPAPPPPPPPPPPPRPPSANEAARDRTVVVTGSLLGRAPPSAGEELKSQSFGALAAPRAAGEATQPTSADRAFVARLQQAVQSGNHRDAVKLIAFPLRVNFPGGTRVYEDAESVERDFALIFTAKVTRAILGQRPDRLFIRDQGAMIGDGEVWFSATCRDAECSPPGPVRITAINP